MTRRRLLRALGLVVVWLLVAVPLWGAWFRHSSVQTVVASHDAVVRPDFTGRLQLDLGPYLPDLRTTTGGPVGVDIELGKTTATTTQELAERYAAIAAHPEAEQERVTDVVQGLAVDTAVRSGALALVPVGVWLLLGGRRRRELVRGDRRVALAGVGVAALVVVLVLQPWHDADDGVQDQATWIPVQQAVPEVRVPDELARFQVQGGLVTKATRRLLASAFDTFARSKVFYGQVVDAVPGIAEQLHQPDPGQTVAVLVSDRHDNIGMDDVVRAVADEAGATAVLDAGDDTSTGETWEAFSLDSLNRAFKGYDARVAIAGNHDNGTFVSRYLRRLGWTHLTGKPVTPFADVRVTGVDDPRSSGLGNWRDEKGLTFDEVKQTIADDVCRSDEDGERIATLVVHDAKLGETALQRGCVDLVLAGHLHVQVGPTRVDGENGKVGWSYTNGTTGGAAYALAVGSKLRRDAELTLVTYQDGRPVGLQPVTVRTTGELVVAAYTELPLS